jgi:hypothetical protein
MFCSLVDLKLVSIRSSSLLQSNSMKIEGILEEKIQGSFISKDEANSWILLEFKNLINPTHYRIEYLETGIGGPLKNWEVQVSIHIMKFS